MIDDIFSAQFHFEDPSGASSTRCYFQQLTDATPGFIDSELLADGLEAALAGLWVNVLASTFWFTGVTVRKVYDNPEPMHLTTGNPQVGLRTGPGLPSNCCLNFALNQSTFGVKSNGRMFLPGVPELDTNVGVIDPAYQAGPVTALANGLVATISALSGPATWKLGVISQKVLNLAPPAKDWPGAFAFVDSISVNPIIAIQRRRTTKVVGAIG